MKKFVSGAAKKFVFWKRIAEKADFYGILLTFNYFGV